MPLLSPRAAALALLLSALLSLVAGPATAQEPWAELEASFLHEGNPVSLLVERATREARLFELRPGRDPIRHPLRLLSPALLERVDAALAKAKAAPWVSISRSSEPERVKALQRCLSAQGHALRDDGAFGPSTERALRRFQTARGLSPSGVVDALTREALGLVPPEGRFQVDGQRELAGRSLAGTLGLLVESALRGAEPEQSFVSGRLEDGGRSLVTPEGNRYALRGLHSGWDEALGMIPSARLELLTWPGAPRATVAGIQVMSSRDSLPLGVAQDRPVEVIGLATVPKHSVQRNLGPRPVGGRVLLVRDAAGRTGTLADPGSAYAPRVETPGVVGALGALGE